MTIKLTAERDTMTMTDDDVMDEAMNWLEARRSGLSSRQQAAFEAWLEDPNNANAFRKMEKAWAALGANKAYEEDARALDQAAVRRDAGVFGRLPRKIILPASIAASLFLAVGVINLAPRLVEPPAPASAYQAQVAEVREVTLEDGSTVFLAPRSAIQVSFTDNLRSVSLTAGEIFLDVAKDDGREFEVVAGATRVVVLGTSFNVKTTAAGVVVSVEEGRVRVIDEAQSASEREKVLLAGDEVKALETGLTDIAPARAESAGRWRSGFREYQDSTLRDVIADARGYLDQDIIIADRELGDLPVAVSYHARDVQEMLDTLAEGWDLTIDRSKANRIVISARDQERSVN